MNKTIIININGIVFHIEEDAYEILKNYMTDVKRHFLNSADSLEITTDIENRIAELFSDILTTENKQVIVEQDVNNVIEQMGRVADFDEIYEGTQNPAGAPFTYSTGERKLFRDTDDHLAGGVCSGIANYFNIQPLWVRLAFALSVFFAGTGLLVYIILWIVIPKAATRADRMAMKGQKLTLQGFKDNLEQELSTVRGHLNDLHEEARPVVYKMRDFAGDFFNHFGIFLREAIKILGKVIGGIALLAAFAGAIAMVCFFVAFMAFDGAHTTHLFPDLITENKHSYNIYIAAFVTAFVPVVMIIILLISALFKTRGVSRTTGTTILIIWICSLSVLIYYITKAASTLREGESFTKTINLKATPNNVYYLKLNDVKYLTHDDSTRLDIKNNFNDVIINNDDDEHEGGYVNLSIEKSDVTQPVLIEEFSARGRDDFEALQNAQNTRYIFTQQDSVIKLDNVLRRTAGGWHQEELHLTLKVPMNAKVIIDQELNNRINLNGISVGDCKSMDKHEDASSATFIMTNDGLQCKIDTVVAVKTKAETDSIRVANNAKIIAKMQAQLDSVKKADSVKVKK